MPVAGDLAAEAVLGDELFETSWGLRRGAGDGARTRDIQLGRKDGTARTVPVFRRDLAASMAHFL
jgi:hypothetical protein